MDVYPVARTDEGSEMTSIIAYRNPLEQWFWEGGALYVLAAIVTAFALYALYHCVKQLFCKHQRAYRRTDGTYRCPACDRILSQGRK